MSKVGIGVGGGQRRSARILAKEEACSTKSKSKKPIGTPHHSLLLDATTTSTTKQGSGSKRTRKRKRLVDVVATSVATPIHQQNRENPQHEVTSIKTDQQAMLSSPQRIPERRILEFVLDMLQRKDTHEIFGQPVDPKEVDGYYTIIKEPMDFGTMRAKLQEGMYTSLGQFERDLYLISSNAMHFNSSTTIFYREARAIHEVSQRVFHVLKTDPENFQLEFSLTRRHTRRKTQGEARGSHTKLAKPGGVKNVVSQNGRSCSSYGPSLRRNTQKYLASSSSNPHDDPRVNDIPSGCGEIVERRTYRPWASFLSENELIVSEVCKAPKPLMQINHRSIKYRESLMLFVEDLGPTAQMVAKRKLSNCSLIETRNCQSWTPAPSHVMTPHCLMIPTSTVLQGTSHLDGVSSHQTPQNFFCNSLLEDSNVITYANKRLGIQGDASNGKIAQTSDGLNNHSGAYKGKMVCANGRMDFHSMVSTGDVIRVPKKDTRSASQEEMAANARRNIDIWGPSTSENMDLLNATIKQYISQQKQKAQITGIGNLISPPAGITSSCTSLHGFGSHFLQGGEEQTVPVSHSSYVDNSAQAGQALE